MSEPETMEQRLRRWDGFTVAELEQLWESVNEWKPSPMSLPGLQPLPFRVFKDELWRAYARRKFPENVVCRRCGSDNHTAENHNEWTAG